LSSSSAKEEEPTVWKAASRTFSRELFWLSMALMALVISQSDSIRTTPFPREYNIFSLLFELTSAFGCVGFSLGYPGSPYSLSAHFNTFGKFLIMILMIAGRHRALPTSVDPAVYLPALLSTVGESAASSSSSGSASSSASSEGEEHHQGEGAKAVKSGEEATRQQEAVAAAAVGLAPSVSSSRSTAVVTVLQFVPSSARKALERLEGALTGRKTLTMTAGNVAVNKKKDKAGDEEQVAGTSGCGIISPQTSASSSSCSSSGSSSSSSSFPPSSSARRRFNGGSSSSNSSSGGGGAATTPPIVVPPLLIDRLGSGTTPPQQVAGVGATAGVV
jgi:Cation transport protein